MIRACMILLVAGLFFGAPDLRAEAPARPDHPADWDPDMREFIGYFPLNITRAEDALLKEGRPDDARLHLMTFFVEATDRGEEKARAMGLQKGWDARMLGFYDTVRSEVRPLTNEPRKAYELAWKLARDAGAGDINPYFWRDATSLQVKTAWHFHLWSSMNGVREANFELATGTIESGKEINAGKFTLWNLAKDGFPSAIQELSSRYESGNGFDASKRKAYYWTLRGIEAGLPLSEQAERLRNSLSLEEVRQIESWRKPPYWR